MKNAQTRTHTDLLNQNIYFNKTAVMHIHSQVQMLVRHVTQDVLLALGHFIDTVFMQTEAVMHLLAINNDRDQKIHHC